MYYQTDAGDRSTLKTIRNGHEHPWKKTIRITDDRTAWRK